MTLMMIMALGIVTHADMIDDIIPHIIMAESSGNPDAVSNRGAVGLMGITPIVLKEYNDEFLYPYTDNRWSQKHLLDPEINKNIGEWYLRRLQTHYLKKHFDKLGENMSKYSKYYDGRKQHIRFANGEFISTKALHPYNITCVEDYQIMLMLSAYNGGITRLRKNNYDINKMPRETRDYVKKIMRAYKKGE